MSTSSHTPGPYFAVISQTWPHGQPELAKNALCIHGGKGQEGYDGNIIAVVALEEHVTEQDWHNAHLLAAAPDLLEALTELIEIERRDNLTDPDLAATDGHRERTWEAARAAVAKAKGGKEP